MVRNSKQYIAQSWCLKNDIKIYPRPIGSGMLKIVVDYKGTLIEGEMEYRIKPAFKDEKWDLKVYALYIHYYDKLNRKTNEKK